MEFYEEVFGEQASTDKVLLQLRELVPKFHAIVHAPKEPNGKYFTAKYVYALKYILDKFFFLGRDCHIVIAVWLAFK